MVIRHQGQTLSEFVIVLAVLTLAGVAIMLRMIGPDRQSGVSRGMQNSSVQKIQADPQ